MTWSYRSAPGREPTPSFLRSSDREACSVQEWKLPHSAPLSFLHHPNRTCVQELVASRHRPRDSIGCRAAAAPALSQWFRQEWGQRVASYADTLSLLPLPTAVQANLS